jgi:hypothetical protein
LHGNEREGCTMLRNALIVLSVLSLPALGPISPTTALAQGQPPADPAPQSPDPSAPEGTPEEILPEEAPFTPLLPQRGRDCEHEQPPVIS